MFGLLWVEICFKICAKAMWKCKIRAFFPKVRLVITWFLLALHSIFSYKIETKSRFLIIYMLINIWNQHNSVCRFSILLVIVHTFHTHKKVWPVNECVNFSTENMAMWRVTHSVQVWRKLSGTNEVLSRVSNLIPVRKRLKIKYPRGKSVLGTYLVTWMDKVQFHGVQDESWAGACTAYPRHVWRSAPTIP